MTRVQHAWIFIYKLWDQPSLKKTKLTWPHAISYLLDDEQITICTNWMYIHVEIIHMKGNETEVIILFIKIYQM